MAEEEGIQEEFMLELYDSNSSEKSLNEDQSPLKLEKQQRTTHDWRFSSSFKSLEIALAVVKEEAVWSRYRTTEVTEGRKIFFRCNQVKVRGKQCAAAVYLLLDSTSNRVELFRTSKSHDHTNNEDPLDHTMTPLVKAEIDKMFNQNMKGKQIAKSLAEAGHKLPKQRQLNNFIASLRKAKFGDSKISMGELEAWIVKNSAEPTNPHDAFVINHELEFEKPHFRFVISTKHLISNLMLSSVLHADATYKIIWQGFPVLFVGVTDRDRHFHIVALAVSVTEKTEDFTFLFRAIQIAAKQYNGVAYEPKVLVCDAAKAITNGFTNIFGSEPCVRMCWAHVKINLQKNTNRCSTKAISQLILQDINMLQLASSLAIFEKAALAFLTKWKNEKEFCLYMQKEWFDQNSNWFEGAAPNSPSTNNALEAFNRVVKDCGTFRKRIALGPFLTVASKMVHDWSNEYAHNKIFVLVPTIPLSLWTTAYQWVKSNTLMVIPTNKGDNEMLHMRIPAKSMPEVPIFEKDWTTFEEYTVQNFSFYNLRVSNDGERWKEGVCNCPSFHKYYICKHVVGVAIRRKKIDAPAAARNVIIGQKRTRGRPALAKRALIIQ